MIEQLWRIMMGNSFRTKTLAAAVSLAIASGGMALTAHAANYIPVAKTSASTDVNASAGPVYILTFVEDGLVAYKGGVAGLQATAPSALGQRKLNANSPAATSYKAFLAAQRDSYLATIQGALGRALDVTHSYSVTQNGVAAEMSAAEAARIAQLPGVKSVRPAGVEHLATYRGPTFIGADKIWDGTATPGNVGTRGQGIVVGILDGGTNSDHPSFANDASCGFNAGNPKLNAVDCSTSTAGVCNGPNPEANPGFGHGVHTSSTVAGNTIDNTATPPPSLPDGTTMSGVAPCAAIMHYKVCQTNTCGGADIVAAIENATTDGVDVLNFSISGGASPWTDNDRGFLDAVEGDVFVAASAGNNTQADPTVIGRVNHRGPWVMTVAASTQDQIIGPSMSVVGPGSPPAAIQDMPLSPGSTTPASSTPTYSGEPLKSYPTNIEGCTDSGGIPAGTFTDSIAVVRRGTCSFTEKITNAFNAGAEMVVIPNNQAGSISMDTTGAPVVPAFSISSQATGDALIAFLASNPSDSTADVAPVAIAATQGDVLADFSYRGPTPGNLADLTKPDITGPGVNIYAALDDQSGDYGFMSGTSMSSPHVAGAAALVRAVRPDWSVTEVKSAMMMTATGGAGTQEDGVTPWNIDDVGSGRVDLTKAALAGLTMDETIANFLAANPSGGSVSVRDLNIPALRNLACSPDCTWTRTVKNQLDVQGTWNVTSDTGAAFTVTASPDNFTLAPGATQEITFTAEPAGAVTEIAFGNVVLSESGGLAPAQHITVAVKGEGAVDDLIFADGFEGASSASFSENFDSYVTGSNVHGQGGWKGWANDSAAAATVVDTQSVSTPNSIEIVTTSDLVHEFSGYTSGAWTITAKQFVPADFTGQSYFIFQNVYSDIDTSVISWSTQVIFDGAAGTVANEATGADQGSTPMVTGQWVDLRLDVDLDADMQTFSYNGTVVFSGSWTGQYPDQGVPGILNIGAIDLFANGASAVYYDDIQIAPASP
jgi:subtilisin family serine protease